MTSARERAAARWGVGAQAAGTPTSGPLTPWMALMQADLRDADDPVALAREVLRIGRERADVDDQPRI